MKIKTYTLKNFQNHEKSILNFHQNVNVISGSSRNGKSALIRGLRLAFENRPTGDEFLPFDCKKGTVSSSEVVLDDITVKRERGTTKNSYSLTKDGNETKYKKFGMSVPEDISDALNLKDYNFQKQHSQYFLLQDTGSEVASKLNDIAGLQVIDKTLSNVNSFVNKAKSDIKVTEKINGEYEQKIEELDFLDGIEPIISKIDSNQEKQSELKSSLHLIEESLDNLKTLESRLEKIEKFLKVVPKIKELQKNLDKHSSFVVRYKDLEKLIEKISTLESELLNLKAILKAKPLTDSILEKIKLFNQKDQENSLLSGLIKRDRSLAETEKDLLEWLSVKGKSEEIESKIQKHEELEINKEKIEVLIWKIENAEGKIGQIEKTIETKEKQKKQIIKDMGICVLCGSKV